jgi:hypothetical protein
MEVRCAFIPFLSWIIFIILYMVLSSSVVVASDKVTLFYYMIITFLLLFSQSFPSTNLRSLYSGSSSWNLIWGHFAYAALHSIYV